MKGLDLIDKVPDELRMEVCDIVHSHNVTVTVTRRQ